MPIKKQFLYKMNIIVGFLMIIHYKAKAQCLYSPVVASDYFYSNCGANNMQQLVDVKVPIYGNNGSLFFTSTLTDIQVISSISDDHRIDLRIYPNPAFYQTNFEWPYDENATLYIISSLGQFISFTPIETNSKNILDIQHLTAGYYIIKVVTASNKTYLTKLIKQ